MKYVYGIYDKVSQSQIGSSLMLIGNDAAAMRAFFDALANPQSGLAEHAADYQLVKYGELVDEDTRISVPLVAGKTVVATGEAWAVQRAEREGQLTLLKDVSNA